MNRTKIEYLDFTWSPLVGCSGVNCAVYAKCWARRTAKRQKHKCLACYSFTPHSHLERIEQPSKVKSSKRIGVCFSADIFDWAFVGSVDLEMVVNATKRTSWHWFINLTKQPQNIPPLFPFPKNWIQGVSVNRSDDLWRIEILKRTPAKISAISFEPLYEDLGTLDLKGIDWVIVGAQTHPHLLPSFSALAQILDATAEREIPLFMKNNMVPLVPKERLLKQYPRMINA